MSEFVDEEDNDKVREAIVERYKRGPDGPIDPWEDASFIVYQVMDHYGFLHKNPLPPGRDAKMEETELERSGKWIKMFSNWKSYYHGDKPSEKLRRRVYKGIPPRVRGEAWKKMLNLQEKAKKGVYECFKTIALENSPDIRQIDLDVNRTYRDHIMFRDRFGVKQQALFHVLAAYSMYNTDVGYCQGMSGIVALLLMYMDEEAAFWALSELLADRKHAMHGLFVPGFPKLLRFQNHHDKIMKKFMPKLYKHLENEGVHTSLYTLKWFMQSFLDRLPFSLVLRVYDIYMIDGDRVLTAMAYHILKIFKKKILKMDFEKIVPHLQEGIPNSHFNDDLMLEELQESMNELKKYKLDQPPLPTQNELPSTLIGTLPDRNSFITASKRARASGDRRSIVEVPIGRPPSPDIIGGLPKSPPRFSKSAPIIPKSTSPKVKNKPLPSYSEYIDNHVNNPPKVKQKHSAERRKDKKERKGSEPKFYASSENNMSPSKPHRDRTTQKWSTELKSTSESGHNTQLNSVNSYDEDIHSGQRYDERTNSNGFVNPVTPLRDYSDSSEYDNYGERYQYSQKTMVSEISTGEQIDYGYSEVNYATETRL